MHGAMSVVGRRTWRCAIAAIALAMLATTAPPDPSPIAAQSPCVTETEPNDTQNDATPMGGLACLEGVLSEGDQDVALWEIRPEDATTRWDVTLDGIRGTLTLLQLNAVTSEPGQAIRLDHVPLLEVRMNPEDLGPVVVEDVLLPVGRYLVAIARSALLAGGEPDMTDYRIAFEPGNPWPVSADTEPNDDAASAQQLADAFEISGDRQGSRSDFYAWTLSEAGRWDLAVTAPLGESVSFSLYDVDGGVLDIASTWTGEARLYDLELEGGTYQIGVQETGEQPQPYILGATPAVAGGDPEPNDGLHKSNAVILRDGAPIRGRLAKDNDRDRFSLSVPAGEPMLRDVRMLWRSGVDRELCLLGDNDVRVSCIRGAEGLALPNLGLSPGEHTFEVSGVADPADPYLLRVDVVRPVEADFETEPNETVETATVIDVDLGMTARGGPDDSDLFRLHIDGEPQLWQVDVTGSEIRRAELVRAGATTLASADIADDGSSARLSDLYLIPGDHWLRIGSTGPEYAVRTTPLGPPDPAGEREPNDDDERSERYRIGERRVGRLPTGSDRDVYRLSLPAPEHLRLRVRQPEDGASTLHLRRGDERLASLEGIPPGTLIDYEVWLQPGDYQVELAPESASEHPYELTSERLDPYALPVDREPNDTPDAASPVAASMKWTGGSSAPADEDWYLLQRTASTEPLRVVIDGEVARARLHVQDQSRQIGLDRTDDGYVSDEPPADVPLLLMLAAEGDYTVDLEGAGLEPAIVPDAPTMTLGWDLPIDRVAAYWPEEQIIDATLDLRNTGSAALEVTLEATTSHHQWSAIPEQETASLPPGDSAAVPVSIVVGIDAWGTEPVLISARARTAEGAAVSSSVEVRPTGEAPPVDPRPGWNVPDELLGGLDAALVKLGAVPGGTLDVDRERRLFDGVAIDGDRAFAHPEYGVGFSVFVQDFVDQLPIEVEVDLAGEDPVPVVGTIINPRAAWGRLGEAPREFELLLSADGRSWTSVLEGSLTPVGVDQAFVLEAPVPATHAKLRIHSKHLDQGGYLSIGEWKTVVAPGIAMGDEAFDVADAAFGGHVVTMEPLWFDLAPGARILDADLARETIDLSDSRSWEMVIGFQDGRAAQITELEWVDPAGPQSDERLDRVDVAASTLGPTGPWRSLGTWELDRQAPDTVASFDLEAPTWARYVRLRGAADPGTRVLELPAKVRILERATDATYRSILGEWGHRSRRGPYEWLNIAEAVAADDLSDAGDGHADATELVEGIIRSDRAEIDADEDWYVIDVPAERNTLSIVVDGTPTVGVALTLFDDTGAEHPMDYAIAPDGSAGYQASVDPERRYALQVVQPPFSAIFAFDASDSMRFYRDRVIASLRSFLADVRPGREVVALIPFEEPPLLEGWQDDPYLLQDAFANYTGTRVLGSSGAEAALIDASRRLSTREGARAILLLTDAETSSADRTPELWEALERVRPIVFSVHIGGILEPVASRQRMQDWAAAGGGHYSYPATRGEMDRAFERMATWLRRPAAYSLTYQTLDVQPASLTVVPSSQPDAGGSATALAPGVGVEIILDTSGSMRKKLDGKRRIDIAKAALRTLVSETLAEGVPVAIRTFGGPGPRKQAKCASSLTLPLGPLDRETALGTVKTVRAEKKTGTPIAAALAAVPGDLAGIDGLKSVVLITDGAATCDSDVPAAIAALGEAGIDVKLDIVGFALGDEALKAQMADWAALGGGAYYDAAGAKELARSLITALGAPFRVYGPDTEPLAAGSVGGEPVELDPGVYRVEVLTEPPIFFDHVELDNGASVILELPGLAE